MVRMSIITTKVKLVATEKEGVSLNLSSSGSFLILVSDVLSAGSSATFSVCKTEGKPAIVNRQISAVGSSLENPTISWIADGQPMFKYMNYPKDEADREFLVTVITHDTSVGSNDTEPE